MDKYVRRRIDIEGKFILHLRMQNLDLPIRHIREMEKRYGTLDKLGRAGVITVSELCSIDYMRLKEIIGTERADLIFHLLGLYGLKAVPSRVITAGVTTTEPPGHGEIIL